MKHGDYHEQDLSEVIMGVEEERRTQKSTLAY